jgi:hypothetical protein
MLEHFSATTNGVDVTACGRRNYVTRHCMPRKAVPYIVRTPLPCF